MFLHQKTKKTGIHNPKKGDVIGKKRSRRDPWWGEVAQRWSSTGQLSFTYNILVAVSTNIGLCEFNNRGTRYQTWTNSSISELRWLRNFMKNWKGLGGVDMGHLLQRPTLVKTAYLSYCYMLSPLSLPCPPNDEVVFTMVSSASVWK